MQRSIPTKRVFRKKIKTRVFIHQVLSDLETVIMNRCEKCSLTVPVTLLKISHNFGCDLALHLINLENQRSKSCEVVSFDCHMNVCITLVVDKVRLLFLSC